MEFGSFSVKKIHILRVDPGEDVLGSVRKFIAESGLKQAVVIGAYGTLAEHHLHWVRNNRIIAQDIHGTGEGEVPRLVFGK